MDFGSWIWHVTFVYICAMGSSGFAGDTERAPNEAEESISCQLRVDWQVIDECHARTMIHHSQRLQTNPVFFASRTQSLQGHDSTSFTFATVSHAIHFTNGSPLSSTCLSFGYNMLAVAKVRDTSTNYFTNHIAMHLTTRFTRLCLAAWLCRVYLFTACHGVYGLSSKGRQLGVKTF